MRVEAVVARDGGVSWGMDFGFKGLILEVLIGVGLLFLSMSSAFGDCLAPGCLIC
jgi:hypothetical protein